MRQFTTFAAVKPHQPPSLQRIVILASGSGSNAARIMQHFAQHPSAEVVGVISDRKHAGVHEKAAAQGIHSRFVGAARRRSAGGLLAVIQSYQPDLIVLAGYLQMVPVDVLDCFAERVINVHPALLPNYGGPGMYGSHVHQAVAAAQDTKSGITIHLANARYDEGRILFQASVAIAPGSTSDEIAKRVLSLEHKHYAPVLEAYLQKLGKQLQNPKV